MENFELNTTPLPGDAAANAKPATASSMFVLPVLMTAVAHPITYVKLLIQIGHEPLSVQEGTTFFGKKIIRQANFVQYAEHIRSLDGWFGLWRGVSANILYNVIGSAVTNGINNKVKEENAAAGKLAVDESTLKGFLHETCNATVSKTTGVVLSYPFHVISIRMMVQFIGRETHHSNIYASVCHIYKEEGIAGFFAGLVPHLVGELVGLWLFRTFNHLITNYLINSSYMSKYKPELQNYSVGISQYLVSLITYPFQLVTNIMAINGAVGLSAGRPPLMPLYSSWKECWVELGKKGLRGRGSTLFRRSIAFPITE